MNKFVIALVASLALIGTVNAGMSRSASSPSRGISLSKSPAPVAKSPGINLNKTPPAAPPAVKGINLDKSAAPAAPASKGINLTKPSTPTAVPVTSGSVRSNVTVNHTVTVVHEHHYFGGGYGYGRGYYGGYSGGFGSSPFFWLWLLDRPQSQPVIVNGGSVSSGATGSYAAPSSGETFVNVVLGLLMLGVIGLGIVWIVRKLFVK